MKEKEILEAIRVLQEANPHDDGIQNWVRYYFPELKESEDERVRKRLIAMCKHYIDCYALDPYNIDDYKEALAWLEKQAEQTPVIEMKTPEESLGIDSNTYNKIVDECIYGEQKPAEFDDTNAKRMFIKALERVEEQNNKGYKLTDCDKISWWEDFKAYTSCTIKQKPANKVEPKFKIGDNIEPIDSCLGSPRTIYKICDGWYETNQGILDFEFENNWRLIEPKPAWSKEDEVKINRIVACLENLNVADNDILLKDVDWLKSLRPRNRWKPSDEQMKALKEVTNIVGNKYKSCLNSLYSDLKKLKG